MPVGFGLISAQRTQGDPRTWSDLYREALDLVQEAERLGFDSVWTTEHHFIDDGYMPSLLPVSAAMAAVTTRIDIGTGVLLAPLYHPLRLAEDAATVSLLAEGRLVLGLGLGWSEIEFEALGADIHLRGRAMSEILDILRQGFSGEVVRHHGRVFDLPEVGIRPVPNDPMRIIIGGHVDAAVRRAARRADGFFSNAAPRRLTQQVQVAAAEMEKLDRDPDTFEWIYYSLVYPCDDPDQGWEEVKDHIWGIQWKYSDMGASAHRTGSIAEAPSLDAATNERLRRRVVLGTPEQIVERMDEIERDARVELNYVLRAYFPRMSYGQQIETLDRLSGVIPLWH